MNQINDNSQSQNLEAGHYISFHQSIWPNLSYEERLFTLQQLENENAISQGRLAREITPERIPVEIDEKSNSRRLIRGYYSQNFAKAIFINKDMIEQINEFNQGSSGWQCASTVTHEGIHAAQDDLKNRRPVNAQALAHYHSGLASISKVQIDSEMYRENMPRYEYFFRMSEVSARAGAEEKIKLMHQVTMAHFGEDQSYRELLRKNEALAVLNLENANMVLGTNYTCEEMNVHVDRGVEMKYWLEMRQSLQNLKETVHLSQDQPAQAQSQNQGLEWGAGIFEGDQ